MYSSTLIVADLELQLLNTFLHSNDVLLKASLIVLELCDLLLKTSAFCFLISVVSLNLLFNSVKLVSESLASVLLLHCQYALECLLLAAEYLSLFLVSVQLFLQTTNSIIQVIQLALKVGGVVGAARVVHVRGGHHRLCIEGTSGCSARARLTVTLA